MAKTVPSLLKCEFVFHNGYVKYEVVEKGIYSYKVYTITDRVIKEVSRSRVAPNQSNAGAHLREALTRKETEAADF